MAFTLSGAFGSGYVNQRYRADFTVSGTFTGPLTKDASSNLPAWANVLVYDTDKVMLWGTPDASGTAPMVLRIKDSTGAIAQITGSVDIAAAPPPAGVTTAASAIPGGRGALLADDSAVVWNTTAQLPGSIEETTVLGVGVTNFAVLVLENPTLTATGTVTTQDGTVEYDVSINEGLHLAGTQVADLINNIKERMGVAGAPATLLDAICSVQEHIGFRDLVGIAFQIIVTETMALAGNGAAWTEMLLQLVDALALTAAPASVLDAQVAVAAALAFGDSMGRSVDADVEETVSFNAAQQAKLQAMVQLLDNLRLQAATTPSVTFSALVDETVAFGESASTAADLQALIEDGIGLLAQITIDDGTYLAWVLNTEARSFYAYSNFNFNSFAKIGEKFYGARDDGIYLLEGDDDAGVPIDAFLREGLADLGGGLALRMHSAYLGIKTDGRMVVKVTVINDQGRREEHWYGVEERPSQELRTNRVKIGKGLKSNYWGRELANVDGSDFELDLIAWYPMVLQRRIT